MAGRLCLCGSFGRRVTCWQIRGHAFAIDRAADVVVGDLLVTVASIRISERPLGARSLSRMGVEATPRDRVAQACGRLGTRVFIARCVDLLSGGDEDPSFVTTLGGLHAARLLDRGLPADQEYWLRVWAARGLLWAGPGDRSEVLRLALRDESWRVREMTCKVVARHRVGELLDDVARLESDEIPRVRRAAERAKVRIVDGRA